MLKRRCERREVITEKSDDDFHDPLAVDLTPGAGDIPADGWPKQFNRPIALLILGYLRDEAEAL